MNFEQIFTLSATKLKNTLSAELLGRGYDKTSILNKKKFLYAEGNAPYMLIAHLDTVHKKLPSIICYSKDGNYVMSPQGIGGDDRCGVYIILQLLDKLPYRPYVVFTMDEEIGGVGADEFATYIRAQEKMPDLKYIVEFDRKGNDDCVFYHCDSDEFVKFVEGFGFTKAYGTFSDISVIAPAMGVAAVNLSSGYYNPHTEHEYVSMNDVNTIIEKSFKMLCSSSEHFEYVEATYSKYYGGAYQGNYNASYKGDVISVSFVPAGSLYICSVYSNAVYTNAENQIVVDIFGNYYRYDATYGDLTSLYCEVAPVGEEMPAYDAKKAIDIPLYY